MDYSELQGIGALFRTHFYCSQFSLLSFGRTGEGGRELLINLISACIYMIAHSFNCFYSFFHCFLPPFAGDCKFRVSLSENHFIISSFLIFNVGLDLGLVCCLVETCNSSGEEQNVGAWMNLPLPVEPVIFLYTNVFRDYVW